LHPQPDGFGKPVYREDVEKALIDAGFITKEGLRHCHKVYEACRAFGFEEYCKGSREAADQVERRVAENGEAGEFRREGGPRVSLNPS
jgi:hypothetical protein